VRPMAHAVEVDTVMESRRDTIPEQAFAAHEHRELGHDLDRVHGAATLVGRYDEVAAAALDVLHWVDTVLEPHAEWEDRWLYPEIDRRAGTHWATKLMGFEHDQIREAAARLAAARTDLRAGASAERLLEVRARMAGLEAVIRAHMEREERFLIPMLGGELETEASSAAS
jgi:DUF438 domain-containing protein